MQLYGFASIISVLAATASAAPMSEQGSELMSPAKRQTSSPCTLWTAQTRLVGDGSPKDKWLWKQVTNNIDCNDAKSCSIGEDNHQTWTVGAEIGGGDWISGGFSVEKSIETGTFQSCEDEEGSTICMWAIIPHLEYEVEDGSFNSCTGFDGGEHRKITSPKKDEMSYKCSTSDCRQAGAQYWGEKA